MLFKTTRSEGTRETEPWVAGVTARLGSRCGCIVTDVSSAAKINPRAFAGDTSNKERAEDRGACRARRRNRLGRAVGSAHPAGRHATQIAAERAHLGASNPHLLRLAAQARRSEHVQRLLTLRSKPRVPIRPHGAQRRKIGSDLTSRNFITRSFRRGPQSWRHVHRSPTAGLNPPNRSTRPGRRRSSAAVHNTCLLFEEGLVEWRNGIALQIDQVLDDNGLSHD
jgi:hypothetical protein